jgi:branched-chain amino acid transport system ATP-binding protein
VTNAPPVGDATRAPHRLVELDHVTKSFGSVRVIDDLSLRLDAGEALGVVGPNGAGKTTMLNLIAGTIRADEGRVVFDGRDLSGVRAHERCRRGIARTHQIPAPFEGLSVFENVLVGLRFGRMHRPPDPHGLVMQVLERTGLAAKANVSPSSLTLLELKRLELARALATGPRLLLLDEIAGGLIEDEVGQLIRAVKDLRAAGITIVWIEHIVHALVSVVDRLLAIDFGRVLAEGKPDVVMADPRVQAVYMGIEGT